MLTKAARGEKVRLPLQVLYHAVAAAYGTTPMAVREWPADEFLEACEFLVVTRG